MKKLLLAIYIILVVTVSLASRAETVPPVILKNAQFKYDEETHTLRMVVKYPSPCIRDARAVLSRSEHENVLYIEANASRFGDGCIQPSAGFSATDTEVTDINAQVLKFELQRLHKNLEGKYLITTRDGSFQVLIDFGKLDTTPIAPNPEMPGLMLMPDNGNDTNPGFRRYIIEINTGL